jgi:hypothetical protein
MKIYTEPNILNHSISWTKRQIKIIEKNYNAKYVLETCLKNKNGEWLNYPVAIFYTEEPHPNGSNYFGIFIHIGEVMITDGISAVKEPIEALMIDNDIIYSRYRWDCVTHNGIMIDGGRDYCRYGGDRMKEAIPIKLRIVNEKLIVENTNE